MFSERTRQCKARHTLYWELKTTVKSTNAHYFSVLYWDYPHDIKEYITMCLTEYPLGHAILADEFTCYQYHGGARISFETNDSTFTNQSQRFYLSISKLRSICIFHEKFIIS